MTKYVLLGWIIFNIGLTRLSVPEYGWDIVFTIALYTGFTACLGYASGHEDAQKKVK
jgi:hypothetical protein